MLTVLAQYFKFSIPFDLAAFQSTAWHRFEPVLACRFIYVIFGIAGSLVCKILMETLQLRMEQLRNKI